MSGCHCGIGSAPVELFYPDALDPVFSGLTYTEPPKGYMSGMRIRIEIELADAVDWSLGIEAGAEIYRKGLPTHCTTLWHAERRFKIRLLAPLTEVSVYLAYRDIFCCLAGLQGNPLIHASCVIQQGQAYVFMAESGGGKSTIAEMLRKETDWVNDEIVWVVPHTSGFKVVNQGQWRGDVQACYKLFVPIRKLYLIEKGSSCREEPLEPADVYAMLLGAPFGSVDPHLGRRAQSTAKLATKIPAYRLQVPLDADEVSRVVFS